MEPTTHDGQGGVNPPGKTTIRFLGTGSLLPGSGHDAPCCLINERMMIDTGYYGAQRLRDHGLDTADLDYLLITHYHPDHVIGLPLLFSHRIAMPYVGRKTRTLWILGPKGPLEKLIAATRAFLELPSEVDLGRVVPLEPGAAFEDDDFLVSTCASIHPVPGLIYRVTDKRTSSQIGLAWDTKADPRMEEHVKGVDLLVHDVCHATPRQAGISARRANARRLALIHGDRPEKAVQEAREEFAEAFWPRDGELVEV